MATLSPPQTPSQSRSDRLERPRAVTQQSYASTHSHRSSKSRDEKRLELIESPRDKRRLEGKSDPTKALHEAQPAAVALEDSNLDSIRSMQHRDREGNVIADPDRSNPTRPRMERPLDTIRSFAAAAEGTTSRRSSYQRRPQSQIGFDTQSRRNSQYGAPPGGVYSPNGRPMQRPMNGQGGYYNNRNSSYGFRPDVYIDENGPQAPPRQHMRYQSAPYPSNPGESPNMMHSHQQSYETMTSGSDEMSKSTNPSSLNSSFDQLHQANMRKPEPGYENSPYRQFGGPMRNPYPPSAMPNGYHNRPSGPTDDYGHEFQAPQAPPKSYDQNGRQMPPNAYNTRMHRTSSASTKEQPKRQSWIKRTFSKRS